MKKSHLAILGGGVLLLAFVVGGYVYKRQAAQKVLAATQAPPAAPGGTAAPADAGKAAPPRLSPVLVRDHAMSAGPADARVILVEYFDPGCETCRVFASFVKSLLQSHPTQVRLVLRYAPFHQGADMMVAILEAARLQNRYWETLQVMYDTQPQWASHHHPQPERIWEFLPSAGVDLEQIRRDIQRPEILAILRQDMQDAQTLGVRRTPAFFVNGKPLMDFGHDQLRQLVQAEIAAKYGPKAPVR